MQKAKLNENSWESVSNEVDLLPWQIWFEVQRYSAKKAKQRDFSKHQDWENFRDN